MVLGGGFKYFLFHPYLGKISNLTNIFQMGWNHQPGYVYLQLPQKTKKQQQPNVGKYTLHMDSMGVGFDQYAH